MEGIRWLALGYNVPINPSKNRVYIWRKLKEYGAEYFKQGVAVLPYNKTNFGRLNGLKGKIRDMGGEASIVELRFLDPADEQDIISRFKRQTDSEITELKADCLNFLQELKMHAGQRLTEYETEQLRRMVKRYSKAKSKGHFQSEMMGDIERGFDSILDVVRATAEDVASQISGAMEK